MVFPFNQKLFALIQKNIIIMKRNIFSTIIEIFFPVIILIVLVLLRKSFDIKIYSFEEQELNTKNFIYKWGIPTTTNISEIYKTDKHSLRWLNMNITSPFTICSKFNRQIQARPLIASIGIPEEIKNQMIEDSLLNEKFKQFNNNDDITDIEFKLNKESFKEFNSIEEMENYIKAPDYLTQLNKLICFGLKFDYDNETNKYDFSLHFFDYHKYGFEGVEDVPDNGKGMFDKFRTGPDLDSFMIYKNGAYLYMMKTVYQYILRKETNDSQAEINFGTIPMKYIDYRIDSSRDYFGYITSIFIIVAYMIPLSLYVYRFVKDKESRIKERMKIMGLKEIDYFLSYFLQYFTISLIISFFNSLLLKIVLNHIPLYFLYFIIFLWSLDVFGLIYFFQSLIDKSRISIAISLLSYLIMYCFSLSCLLEKTSKILKIILSIFPPCTLNIGL